MYSESDRIIIVRAANAITEEPGISLRRFAWALKIPLTTLVSWRRDLGKKSIELADTQKKDAEAYTRAVKAAAEAKKTHGGSYPRGFIKEFSELHGITPATAGHMLRERSPKKKRRHQDPSLRFS